MSWEYHTERFTPSAGFLHYRIDHEAMNVRLNELGRQGWELASCVRTSSEGGSVIAVLKRQR